MTDAKTEQPDIKEVVEKAEVAVDAVLHAAIKKQIEFYFSESNFRKDAFLKAASETHPEGYVPIVVLLTFNKLKALCTDVAIIAAALKDSDTVTVSEDGLNVKRSAELPEADMSKPRTLYVKGFSLEDTGVTIESISEHFSTYGKVMMVRLRRIENGAGRLFRVHGKIRGNI